jgi:putative transposase
MIDKERKAAKWQRKLSRQQRQYAQQKGLATKAGKPLPKTSGKQRKTLARLRKQKRYASNVRDDVAHKATTALANDERYDAFAMESLQIKNMTKAPKAKPDPGKPGRFLPNKAAAKAGLNKAILASMWGRLALMLEYKARGRRKLFIRVDPKHTSQECSQCGHIHPGNRLSQAVFACTACSHSENADVNAAKVIKARMVALVIAGTLAPKPKAKKVSPRKGKSAATGSRGGSKPRPAEEQGEETPLRRFHAPKKRESLSFMAG